MENRIPPRIREYLDQHQDESPLLVVDLQEVERRYKTLARTMPFATCHYAVKANPDPAIVKLLASLGSSFDAASAQEIQLCLDSGATPDKILFGNTIKKQSDIAWAYSKGIRMYVCDSVGEVDKIAIAAPGSKLFARLRVGGEAGAAWPLTKKFGCTRDVASEIMLRARDKGLVPYGISFHVGSQQTVVEPHFTAISLASLVFDDLEEEGIHLEALDIGGGFPAQYRDAIPPIEAFGEAILEGLEYHFDERKVTVLMEPGRYICADAGVLRAEVVLISYHKELAGKRWVYLDIGKFSGLVEAEAIQYRIVTDKDTGKEEDEGRVILAGPTCDSIDVIYEEAEYYLPNNLAVGDRIYFLSAGAYTTTYSSIGFNGFPPLRCVCI